MRWSEIQFENADIVYFSRYIIRLRWFFLFHIDALLNGLDFCMSFFYATPIFASHRVRFHADRWYHPCVSVSPVTKFGVFFIVLFPHAVLSHVWLERYVQCVLQNKEQNPSEERIELAAKNQKVFLSAFEGRKTTHHSTAQFGFVQMSTGGLHDSIFDLEIYAK